MRSRCCRMAICSLTFLSISGFTCAGIATLAPATVRLLSPSTTCAVSFGSIRQLVRISGRAVIATLPAIAALALRFLIETFPICLATLPPSTLPSALSSADPPAVDNEPITVSLPSSGVEIDNTFCDPSVAMGPRATVQSMSALDRIWPTGLSTLPPSTRGAARSRASRIAVSETAMGVMISELRDTGGKGGSFARTGLSTPTGHSQFIAARLTKNDTMTTERPSRIDVTRMRRPDASWPRCYRRRRRRASVRLEAASARIVRRSRFALRRRCERRALQRTLQSGRLQRA